MDAPSDMPLPFLGPIMTSGEGAAARLPLELLAPGQILQLTYDPVEHRHTTLAIEIREPACAEQGGIAQGIIRFADFIPQHERILRRHFEPPYERRPCAIIGACTVDPALQEPYHLVALSTIICGRQLLFTLCFGEGRAARCILPEKIADWRVAV